MKGERRSRAALWVFAALVLLATVAKGPRARANGRYPASQFLLVGTGASSEVIVLRTTFGIVESLDGGRTWAWLCEDLFGYGNGPPYDPPIALGSRGPEGVPLLVGLSAGAARTTGLCSSERVTELGAEFSGDFTSVGTGAHMLWVASNGGGIRNRVFASYDGGRSFVPLNDGLPGVLFETIEVSPSDPMRVYLTGVQEEPYRPVFYRSEDGGRTLREVPMDLHGGRDAFISGIDPTHPEVVYVRSTLEEDGSVTGTLLLRSRDGGAHFEVLLRSRGPMLGFALSGDGRTLWAGGPDPGDRLMRSDDGGPFVRVSDTQVLCLRWHPSGLYLCANHLADRFAIGRSDDQGETFTPMLRFEDLRGPSASCPPGTAGRDLCVARWPQVRRLLGIADVPTMDAGAPAPMDVSTSMDSPGPRAPPAACGCRTERSKTLHTPWFIAILGGSVFCARRRQKAPALTV